MECQYLAQYKSLHAEEHTQSIFNWKSILDLLALIVKLPRDMG